MLALIVVVSHYAYLSGNTLGVPIDGPAVVGFFFLSGYWVNVLWDSKYSRTHSPLLTFYISRAWRIYPLAITATVITGIIKSASLSDIAWNAALFGLKLGNALDPPAWSLAIEVQFYAVAPFLFVALKSRSTIIGVVMIGAVCWLAFAANLTGTYLWTFILPFALGALYAEGKFSVSDRMAVASLVGFIVLGIVPAVLYLVDLMPVARYVAIALSAVLLPYIAASVLRRSGAFDLWLGNLAYPIYLIHWPMFLVTKEMQHPVIMAAVLTAGCSILFSLAIDRPLEALRRRFVASRRADDEVVSPPSRGRQSRTAA